MNIPNLENTPLTKENFLLYAAREYNNPHCLGCTEFNNDIKRLMYIKRILKKYERTKETDLRLLVNHIVIINNLFNPVATCRMLYFYCDSVNWPTIIAILKYLNISITDIPELNKVKIKDDDFIVQALKEL